MESTEKEILRQLIEAKERGEEAPNHYEKAPPRAGLSVSAYAVSRFAAQCL